MQFYKILELISDRTGYSEETRVQMLLEAISRDAEAMDYIFATMARDRETKDELIRELNHELSRADVFIKEVVLENRALKDGGNKQKVLREFILEGIEKFYKANAALVKHCYPKKED